MAKKTATKKQAKTSASSKPAIKYDDWMMERLKKNKKEAIGIVKDGKKVRGFKTPSRKFEICSNDIINEAKKLGEKDDGFPHFKMPKSLKEKKEDELILTTFKWNVHTQARTTPQKYLTEIVHDNPVWINTQTAKKYKIKNGDIIKITTYKLN